MKSHFNWTYFRIGFLIVFVGLIFLYRDAGSLHDGISEVAFAFAALFIGIAFLGLFLISPLTVKISSKTKKERGGGTFTYNHLFFIALTGFVAPFILRYFNIKFGAVGSIIIGALFYSSFLLFIVACIERTKRFIKK